MALLDELKLLEIDIDAGLKHFKGNAALFERLLRKFPASVKDRDIQPLIDSGEIREAYEQAHALKGICANLYLTSLYKLYTEVSDSLKAGKTEGVSDLLNQISPLQEKIIATIEGN